LTVTILDWFNVMVWNSPSPHHIGIHVTIHESMVDNFTVFMNYNVRCYNIWCKWIRSQSHMLV
jgi:hypothetical protein